MIIISFPNMVFSQNLLLIITASMAALVGVAAACSNGECRLHDECSSNQDCEAGLYCLACPLGFPGTRCVRSTITDQFKLLNNSLPFNKYAFLATHNAYAIDGYPSHTKVPRITFTNQEDSVMDQLNNGARALMLDTYDFRGDVWLCHSFKGKCHDYTAFVWTFYSLLIKFSEIVTIILEDYVRAPNGLTKVFTDAGLMKYWFPVTNMPKNGQDWPLVNDMVQNNQRLLVFTSIQSKEASEGIAYQWNYMVENQYGNIGMKAGSCTNRKESPPLNDTSRSLVLVNYFRCIPMKKLSCEDNSRNLINMLHTCNGAATNRWANFVAVDYYKRSEGGGSFQAVDLLNGKLLCGCDDIHACVEESQEEYNNNKGAQVELLQQDGLYITRSSDGLISRKEEIV
ncbi:PI-PLC X domain-containing protein At5g67130-like isoform X2 [Populus nigra]|uniref:PI-PLC X domain-containing protein At5g67130-like isoform X2 n=1 Tax=Populus nigra TaxID=3691 RepID=UPI002B277B04|nr:PI-PLC X domain-containing protein At5g67130-like isoform X2 [Populus nigra]